MGFFMKSKICVDCNLAFNSKSNRSIRCPDCQELERKKQKAIAKKSARTKKTLDGRAFIKKDGFLEPISHRGHTRLSQQYLIIAQMSGYTHLEYLKTGIRDKIKFEMKRRQVWNSLKFGADKSDVLKKYRIDDKHLDEIIKEMKKREETGDETDYIVEYRTALRLIDDWILIGRKKENETKQDRLFIRELDRAWRDVSDVELFEYSKYISPLPTTIPVRLNEEQIKRLDKRLKPLLEYIEKLKEKFENNEQTGGGPIPDILVRPIDAVLVYRRRKKNHSL
jgi:DNA-directed RNA polymerase subunit RPC12/RpoP